MTEISGPGLSQLVKTGQTPLMNSPGMHGGTVSQQDFEQLVLQAGDRNDLVIVRGIPRHQVHDIRENIDAGKVDGRNIQHAAHAYGEILVADLLLVLVHQ